MPKNQATRGVRRRIRAWLVDLLADALKQAEHKNAAHDFVVQLRANGKEVGRAVDKASARNRRIV